MPIELLTKEKLISIVQQALEHDRALREQYAVADKFRFIREQLQALLQRIETEMLDIALSQEHKLTQSTASGEDKLVYVYLFNAQGLTLRSWQNMVTPGVFYEYSVNRPIYSDKNHIESLIRGKSNPLQHAFLTMAINKDDLLVQMPEDVKVDSIGNPLVKIREGSLDIKRFLSFTHNKIEYILNEDGHLTQRI